MISEERMPSNQYTTLKVVLGSEFLKGELSSSYDFISIATKGIKAPVIDNFRKYFHLHREAVAQYLNVSEPTVYRWIKTNKTLDRNFSVHLLELTFLFINGSEIFSSQENFFKWLALPNLALGGLEPQHLLNIPDGISKVRDLLGRIEYGVYS